MPAISPVVSVRVTENERDLLEVAAQLAHTKLSDFIRRKALEAAEIDVLNYRKIEVAAIDWERFETWAKAPARAIQALQELAAVRPTWQD